MNGQTIVKIENLSKSFLVDSQKQQGVLARMLQILPSRREKRELQALKRVSFNVEQGECLGIIGKNGSGKSTLLRTIAGIYMPDEGSVQVNGKMIYLTGFRQGLIPKLTMRENVFLMGAVMGLPTKEIKNKFDEIVNFSGLNEFVDMKVYQFSSGMVSRLSFSVAINSLKHHKPDLLLLDEVFSSGGDIEFQEKSLKKTEELIKEGSAVIMATHSMGIAKKYCGKAILLENGRVAALGGAEEVAQKYMAQRPKNPVQGT